MAHYHLVIVVDMLRIPFGRQLFFQNPMRRPHRRISGNEAEPHGDPVVVAVHRQGLAT